MLYNVVTKKNPGNAALPKESKKRWAKHPSHLQDNLFSPVEQFVLCVLPTLATHFPLPNPPWPDKQAGGPVFPGTRTWKTLSTNFTQAGGGVQKDSLEV